MKFPVAFALLVGAAWPSAAQSGLTGPMARQLNDAFTSVYEKVAPAVVVVEVQGGAVVPSGLPQGLDFFFRAPDGRRIKPPPEQGSGFVISPDGLILTNNHVVSGSDGGTISVTTKDGRKYPAELIGRDEKSDIAVLKIDAKNLPTVELADSDAVKVGQFAFAIGAPFDLPYTFTVGVVSAKGRTNLTNNPSYEEYIQTDASINPGNSGGPLVDLDGKVIGVNTLISGLNRGLGFAVPSNIAKSVADQLVTTGKVSRAWLGISIVGLDEDDQLKNLFPGLDSGVVVENIQPRTPAFRSKLQAGDVILSVDGRKVAAARDVQREILTKRVGQKVDLEVWRNGRKMQIDVTTGEQPDNLVRASNRIPVPAVPMIPPDEPPTAMPAPGPDTLPEVPNLHGLVLQEERDGRLAVTGVIEGSPADIAGFKPGDTITEAGGKPVRGARQFESQISSAGSRGIMVLLEREGQTTFAILKP